MTCKTESAFVEERIDRVATQYREATKLLGMFRAYLGEIAEAYVATCSIFDHFDIDDAIGDQLTILGKALGWPRVHCAGRRRPVFGLICSTRTCAVPAVPIAGLCEGEFDCGGPEYVPFEFRDDELYRRFLKARIISLLRDWRREAVTEAARHLFGEHAVIYREQPGVLGLATGRLLDDTEISIAHLYRQVMPVAHGVRLDLYHSDGPVFGFGSGWGGLCDGSFAAQIPMN